MANYVCMQKLKTFQARDIAKYIENIAKETNRFVNEAEDVATLEFEYFHKSGRNRKKAQVTYLSYIVFVIKRYHSYLQIFSTF